MTTDSLFKWHHFLPEIILLNVRWYCRYSLSYRNLEEMMAERGVAVDHSTLNRARFEIRLQTRQAHSSVSESNQ
ncbi:integrase, catalytic region (plasmid) [Leptolyngbya boryana NIES-2135]|jgi:IS6 family transposase|uniref:Integrase, catalytic region n=1 Tax=Leptolyngbya boryana NIES-2135 TaxID=1973484 RepID=A0A1Z4JSF8_LEPBY|nr:Mobile element protein [Leptolyngbya boryana IAM M-101]BAS66565.1 Mobile element protein [Leptolyngbya boryana dg5]BAY59652.1 integrase, catalytic region [Leptolyngbya boryana NIES-2135]